jgi:ketosteroid isomerase-like protein
MVRHTYIAAILSAGVMFGLGACTGGSVPGTQVTDQRPADEVAIRSASDSFKDAISSRDLGRILSFYTDDGWQLPNSGQIARTAADRKAFWNLIVAQPIAHEVIDVSDHIDIARSGDVAVQYGEFRQLYANQKGETKSVPQIFIIAWRKEANGGWKVAASMSSVHE